ncbi:glycosyltransferase [Tissierella praeacuta]|uniref:MGDG synthase family glycosyltransferase n=1 Tax=Tissierella praeacuta TaxID=43131 RepID=UPI00333F6CE4
MAHNIDILILTAGFGSGHLLAAKGIKESIEKADKTLNIEIEDAFKISIPRLSDAMYRSYNILIRKNTGLYNYFHYKDNEKPKDNAKKFSNKYIINRLKNHIININPKLIISTFPVISQYLSILKDKDEISVPLITCITDVVNGWEWITTNSDMYFVATKHVKNNMLDMGIEDEKITVTGIPLRKEFLELPRPINNIKLPQNNKLIMIMGGGMGLVPEDDMFYRWINGINNTKTLVLTGNNQNLYKSISRLELENIITFRYTNEVPSLMAQSDLLISKAGGITLFEAISSDLPFIAYEPKLGQEIENAEFIYEEKIGSVASDMEELKRIILELINDENKINIYKTNIEKIKENINMDILADKAISLLRE